jgi:hypothetical protein
MTSGLAILGMLAGIAQLVTMFLPRAAARYSEDYLTTYRPDVYFHGKPGEGRGPFQDDAFLFLWPAVLEVLLLAAVVGIALLVIVRPGRAQDVRRHAALAGLALVAVAVANATNPSWGVIEFRTLDAAYAAVGLAVVATTATLAAAFLAGRRRS